jgi:hypothetical protein
MMDSNLDGTPKEVEIEKSILATIFSRPEKANDILAKLSRSDFYDGKNSIIFQKCAELNKNGAPIEIAAVFSSLTDGEKKSISGLLLSQLLDETPVAMDSDFYINKLKEATAKRLAREGSNAIWKKAGQSDCSIEEIANLADSLTTCIKDTLSYKKASEIITFDELYASEVDPVTPIAEGFLNEGESAVLYGKGGTLKSMLSMDMGMSVGAKIPNLWGEFPIPKARCTLIIQSENSRQTMRERMRLKCTGNQDFIQGLGYIASPVRHENILISGDVTSAKFKSYITDCANRIREDLLMDIDLIIFDPLISYHAFDENDNSRMRSTLDSIAEISNATGGTPLIIHHTNKEGGLRGASAIIDWARTIIGVFDRSFTRLGETVKQIEIVNDKRNNAKEFKNFILRLDEYLNFYRIEPEDSISKKARDRCLAVREALEYCGGRVSAKSELINQYCENTGANKNTAQRHINEAKQNGFIQQEFYTEGKLKKARYFLPDN